MPLKPLLSRRRAILAGAILVVLAIPVPHRVAPAWPVRLVDQSGLPQADIATTQTWRHRVYRPEVQAETRRSDPEGRLTFPERTVWASGLRWLYGVVANLVQHGPTAAFGPDVWLYAKVNSSFGGSNVYTPGQTPPDTLVLYRYGVCPASTAPDTPAGTATAPGGQPEPMMPGLIELPVGGGPTR